jgi:phage tail sheath protein FI
MAELLRPDVFVEERQSEIQPIEGVGTTTGAFVGVSEMGPPNDPQLITSWSEFTRKFGSFYTTPSPRAQKEYLAYTVRGFFENGGKRCYVVRVSDGTEVASSNTFQDEDATAEDTLTVSAKTPGEWGDQLSVEITHNPIANTPPSADYVSVTHGTSLALSSVYGLKAGSGIKVADSTNTEYRQVTAISGNTVTLDSALTNDYTAATTTVVSDEFDVKVYRNGVAISGEEWTQLTMTESYSGVSFTNYVEAVINDESFGSDYIAVTDEDTGTTDIYTQHPAETTSPTALTGGDDGITDLDDNDFLTGLDSLAPIDEINTVAIPGENGSTICTGLETFVATTRSDVFAVTAGASGATPTTIASYRRETAGLNFRKLALYYPWVEVRDEAGVGQNAKLYVPPEGHVMGAYTRNDVNFGVYHAPAGYTAQLRGVVGLQTKVSDGQREILNPLSVNCIISKTGPGTIVYGARTLSATPEFKYVNVMRTLLFLEESIADDVGWAVFKPNNEALWQRLRVNISAFLYERWREGFFEGATPSEAYFVEVSENNNPQTSINEGKVIVDIGVAIVKPAEFVVLRFINWDGGRVVEELGLRQ